MTTLPRRALRDARTLLTSPVALVILLLLMAGAGSLVASFPHEGGQAAAAQAAPSYPPLTDQERSNIEKWWDVQPKEDLPIPTDGAKVLIVKFSDYMCPACRQTDEAYRPILAKYGASGAVRFVLKHYPLEAECNQYAAGGNHYASCEAAAAVVMARSKGTADKLSEWLFTNQTTLTRDVVRKAAKDIGGVPDFDARYDSAMQEVKMDAGLGALVKVKSTPTFFINGRRIEGGVPPQALEGIIELALKRAE
jgi:protein-disulfide isomerase